MNKMEKVIVKIELDRDDVSAMMRLAGSKLTDEQWGQNERSGMHAQR